MDFILRKDICKEFIEKYNKKIYPQLLSKIIEIGILTLKLSFNKLLFSPEELDDIIYSLNKQSQPKKRGDFEFNSLNKITNKRLRQKRIGSENLLNNTMSFNDKKKSHIYLNNSNFYDLNYYIPQTKSFRNKQLYQKRLENPLFTTQNKEVYPFWWWNFPESEKGQNLYDSNYISKSLSRRTKNENTSKSSFYDEDKIFQKKNYNSINNVYNNNLKNYDRIYNKQNLNKINKNNYKITFDKNLNVIGVKKQPIKTKK